MTTFQWFMFIITVLSTLILVILVRLFQCSSQQSLCSSTRTHIFYVLVYSAFYLLVRLFQCSSQHNLCAHQRALVRAFIVSENYMTKFQWFMFSFTVLSTLILVILVRLFQCSSQHNLCAHQRAGTPRGFYSLPRLFSKLDSCRAFNSFISLSLRLIVLGLSSDRVSALSDFRHRLAKFAKQEDQYQNIVLYVESLSEKLYTSSFCGWVIFLDKIKISSFVGDLSRWLLQHKSERSASQCKNLMAAFYPEYPRYWCFDHLWSCSSSSPPLVSSLSVFLSARVTARTTCSIFVNDMILWEMKIIVNDMILW